MRVLDDREEIATADSLGLHQELTQMHGQLAESYARSRETLKESETGEPPRKLALAGVGSSGLAAELVADYLRYTTSISCRAVKDFRPSPWLDEDTLFVGVSKSGETLETQQFFRQAADRGCSLAVVSTGGRMEEEAEETDSTFLRAQDSLVSRGSTLSLIGCLVALVGERFQLDALQDEVGEASEELRSIAANTSVDVETDRNFLKIGASELAEEFVHIIPTPRMRAVALRLHQQLNENAKKEASRMYIPDAFHSTILPLEYEDGASVVIKEESIDRWSFASLQATERVLPNWKKVEITCHGEGLLSQLCTGVLQTDWLSYYIAILNEVDPGPTSSLKEFKKHLEELWPRG